MKEIDERIEDLSADSKMAFFVKSLGANDADQPHGVILEDFDRIHPSQLSLPVGRVVLLKESPGAGRFSIGRKLFEMFDHRYARFIDNHLLIDPVQAIIPGRGAGHRALRHAFRRVAFDALDEIADTRTTLIFPSCLSSTDEDQQVFEEYLGIASRRQIPLYLINISCDREEHYSRLVTVERSLGSKTKLVTPEVLEEMLDKHKLVALPHDQNHFPRIPAVYMCDFDTTNDSIEESAVKILETIGQQTSLTIAETRNTDEIHSAQIQRIQ